MPRRTPALWLFATALVLLPGDVRSQASAAAVDAGSPRASGERNPELDPLVHALAKERALAGASLGIAVLDVDSGRVLAAVNEHAPLNPASNAKLFASGSRFGNASGRVPLRHDADREARSGCRGGSTRRSRLRGSVAVDGQSLGDGRAIEGTRHPACRGGHRRRPAFLRRANDAARLRTAAERVVELSSSGERRRRRRELHHVGGSPDLTRRASPRCLRASRVRRLRRHDSHERCARRGHGRAHAVGERSSDDRQGERRRRQRRSDHSLHEARRRSSAPRGLRARNRSSPKRKSPSRAT